MELFNDLISNLGFPIAVTAFLLIRVEKKLDELNKSLMQLAKTLGKTKQ